MPKTVDIPIASAYKELFEPYRYKVYYGGRGKGSSWSYARALIIKSLEQPLLILCTREFQSSISDSVYRIIQNQVSIMGLEEKFEFQKNYIRTVNGSEFIFKGIRRNPQEIKSTEGVDIAWLAEAERTSNESLDILVPTIRKEGSEIWVEFNPDSPDDPIYQRFVKKTLENAVVKHLTYRDNPFLPETLRREMEWTRKNDPDRFHWIWEGQPRQISEAIIFQGKYSVQPFEVPEDVERFYYGVDWGFANDPTVMTRCFVYDDCLYIDYEAYGIGVEINELPQLFDSIPGAREWPSKADSARPETISYMQNQGFNMESAKKWSGSIEDGIAYIKSFEHIYIHPRCKHTADEFGSYQYKIDKQTGDILPIVVDKKNHAIDSIRYSLADLIKKPARWRPIEWD